MAGGGGPGVFGAQSQAPRRGESSYSAPRGPRRRSLELFSVQASSFCEKVRAGLAPQTTRTTPLIEVTPGLVSSGTCFRLLGQRQGPCSRAMGGKVGGIRGARKIFPLKFPANRRTIRSERRGCVAAPSDPVEACPRPPARRLGPITAMAAGSSPGPDPSAKPLTP